MLLGMTILVGWSDEFVGGEEVGDFERGSFGRVGAVSAVVLDALSELAADGAGSGIGGIGGAHYVASLGDGTIGFEDEGKNFSGAHEVGEVLEEGACLVHRVEALGFAFRQAHRFESDDAEPGLVNAREDFPLKAARNGVRFDQCQSSFESQADSSRKQRWPPKGGRYTPTDLPRAAATVEPISAGGSTVLMPAARRAAHFSFAVP